MMLKHFVSLPILILAAALGCGDSHNHDHAGHNHNHGEGDAHGHAAPHGGVLVNVENEFCHLEFVLEPGTDRLQLHAMRFHPRESPLKFFMEKIEATAKVGEAEKTIIFKPTELDGVTATTQPTSLYVAQIDWINDTPTFTGTLTELKIEGKSLTKITFHLAKKE
ncbi:MAG: hypothetical protein H8E27_10920 [Verrucomicrobia subdivision 3 bacterium]|nr:hypothetical protein [Limisphaerales bacterium]